MTALVQPGTEDALIRRVADRLPTDYQAALSDTTPVVMTADAGFYVGAGRVDRRPRSGAVRGRHR